MTEQVRRISENSYVKLGWALTIMGSCLFAAFRIGCMCEQLTSLQSASSVNRTLINEHDKRITSCETWAKVHEAKDVARP